MNYNLQTNLTSTADYGGRKILGMSGSLMDFINTGNAYYNFKNQDKGDSFVKKESSNKLVKSLPIIAAAGAGISALVLALKGKLKINTDKLKNGAKKIFKSDKINTGKLKNGIKNIFKIDTIKEKLSKINPKKLFKSKA